MTVRQILTQIELDKTQLQMWKGRMKQSEINWFNARITELKAMLPGAKHNDKVNAFGFASVERNV